MYPPTRPHTRNGFRKWVLTNASDHWLIFPSQQFLIWPSRHVNISRLPTRKSVRIPHTLKSSSKIPSIKEERVLSSGILMLFSNQGDPLDISNTRFVHNIFVKAQPLHRNSGMQKRELLALWANINGSVNCNFSPVSLILQVDLLSRSQA